jgi:hypothetical protein
MSRCRFEFQFASLVIALATSSVAFGQGYTIRCNREQTQCEVDTKRLTRGDRVGIFDEDNNIVAVGTVTALKDRIRIFKIDKKLNPIYRDAKQRFLSDTQAENPLKYFTTPNTENKMELGVNIEVTSVGVGNGFMATGLGAFFDYRLFGHNFVVGRFYYLKGSGVATNSDLEVDEAAIDVSSFGLLGGIAIPLITSRTFGLRGEFSLGFGSTSVATDAPFDGTEIIEGKVGGTGLAARAELDAIYHMGKFNPFIGLSYFRLQSANNYTFSAGAVFEF